LVVRAAALEQHLDTADAFKLLADGTKEFRIEDKLFLLFGTCAHALLQLFGSGRGRSLEELERRVKLSQETLAAHVADEDEAARRDPSSRALEHAQQVVAARELLCDVVDDDGVLLRFRDAFEVIGRALDQ